MLLKLLTLYCLLAISFAWLPPERCQQDNKQLRSATFAVAEPSNATIVRNIEDVAAEQHESLLVKYKDYRFFGIPIRASVTSPSYKKYPEEIEINAPFNCTFHTYDPHLLSQVDCNNAECHLSHEVSTVASYTATEEYNWGVTFSSKVSFLEIFEVGGELSTGGSYSCAYTREKSVSDSVECVDTSGTGKQLLLYNVRSDMMCDFGGIKLTREGRDHGRYDISFPGSKSGFTSSELQQLRDSVQVPVGARGWFVMDTSKVTNSLLRKLLNKVPLYNPYTDLLMVDPYDVIRVLYFKQTGAVPETRSIVPFTNEAGNSVYKYACVKI